MNIDISNAHCGPRIQFLDHAWLRVVYVPYTACVAPSNPRRRSPLRIEFFLPKGAKNVSESGLEKGCYVRANDGCLVGVCRGHAKFCEFYEPVYVLVVAIRSESFVWTRVSVRGVERRSITTARGYRSTLRYGSERQLFRLFVRRTFSCVSKKIFFSRAPDVT